MDKIDKAIRTYQDGTTPLDETNAVLHESGAAFHLQSLTDEERAEKQRREDALGYAPGDRPPLKVPKKVDTRRKYGLIGKPEAERRIVQHTRRDDFLCEYDEQGYYVKATRLRKGEAK